MDKATFEQTWARPLEFRSLFPYWSDKTFKAYVTRKNLPFEQVKIGGRYYVRRADVEEFKTRTNNGLNFNPYVEKALKSETQK